MTFRGPAPVRPRRSAAPGPSPKPTEVTKSTRSTNDRRLCRTTTITSRQDAAISGAPPAPGSRTFGLGVIVADDRGVDVAELVDLGGTEEADADPAGLQPVVEDLRHAHHRVRGLGEDPVTDGQRQPVRLGPDRARLVDEHQVRRVRGPGQVGRRAGQPDADEAGHAVVQGAGGAGRHHLVGGEGGRVRRRGRRGRWRSCPHPPSPAPAPGQRPGLAVEHVGRPASG